MLRSLAPALVLALVAPLAGAAHADPVAAPADPAHDAALSSPREDSYYPAKGDPGVDALHYDLDLSWDRRKRRLSGVADITLRATADADRLQLDLARSMAVSAVEVDGATAGFTHRRDHLVVAHPVTTDGRYTLRVTYAGTPRPTRGPATRDDVAEVGMRVTKDGRLWTMQEPWGALTWYPVNDHPSDKALYDLRVTTPQNWRAVSNGRLVTSYDAGRRRRVTAWTNEHPTASYLVTLAVGPYGRTTQRGPHGLKLDYWTTPEQAHLVKPLRMTKSALGWLEKRLGPYPFDTLGIVVTPSDSAMETQTMITLGADLYDAGPERFQSVVVHELVHQWYGDTVTPSDWSDLWMNEGMATYLEKRWAVDQGWYRWRQWQRHWAANDQYWRRTYGPPGAFERGEFGSINVYYCTALMWDRLRGRLGTATFDRLVREWPQSHLDSNQTRRSMVAWFEERTGERLRGFFRKWLTNRRSPA